jgi:hypothetical protein
MVVFAIFLICFGLFALYMALHYRLGERYFTAYVETHPHWEDHVDYSKHSGIFRFLLKYPVPISWTYSGKAF